MNALNHLTSQNFTHFVQAGTKLVFVKASWSGASQSMSQVVEQLGAWVRADVCIGFLDADEELETVKLLTEQVPSLHIFRNGEQVHKIVGYIGLDQLLQKLVEAGVPLASPLPGPAPAAATTPASLAFLADFLARVRTASQVPPEALSAMIATHSAAASQSEVAGPLTSCVTAALAALRELPEIAEELAAAVANERLPTFRRLGALAALLYGNAPLDPLPDSLPGSYGYLDDWLVLNSARWLYLRTPETSQLEQITMRARGVWLALPPAFIPLLQQFVMQMELERNTLQQQPDAVVRQFFEQLRAHPAPVQFVVPVQQRQAAASSRGMGGWSRNAHGAIWGDGSGDNVYMRFEGGGSIGMVGGKIVGGP